MPAPDTFTMFTDALMSATQRFAHQIPTAAAAFLLLLIGMFTARTLRTVSERVLERARLDEHTSKVGINEMLARLGLGKSPAFALSFLVYWFILFIFIVSAANAVNMTAVSELLERFVLFLPSLIAAVLILFAGMMFARFLAEVVSNAAAANAIRGGSLLAESCYAVVLVFSAMTAMEQLGMRLNFISSAIQILIGSAGLAAAIAFGLGGKDAAAELIRDLLNRRK